MTVVAVIFFVVAALEAAVIVADHLQRKQQAEDRERIWCFLQAAEEDKRALTESLCRAQGKPFIPVQRAELKPSEGWWDAKPQIKIAPKDSKAYQ